MQAGQRGIYAATNMQCQCQARCQLCCHMHASVCTDDLCSRVCVCVHAHARVRVCGRVCEWVCGHTTHGSHRARQQRACHAQGHAYARAHPTHLRTRRAYAHTSRIRACVHVYAHKPYMHARTLACSHAPDRGGGEPQTDAGSFMRLKFLCVKGRARILSLLCVCVCACMHV